MNNKEKFEVIEKIKELKMLVKTIEDIPDSFPDFESDDYDSGFRDAKNKILEIIESNIKKIK